MEQETIRMTVNEYQNIMDLVANQTRQIETLNREIAIAKEIMLKDEEIIIHQRKVIEDNVNWLETFKKQLIDCEKK
jgi:Tat protein secretion system quality control protein TatD with DNase activity